MPPRLAPATSPNAVMRMTGVPGDFSVKARSTSNPPAPSMRLTKDVILFTTREMPKWNPINVCSYHLQEAGATPVQELAFALATAIAVLDTVQASGAVERRAFGEVVGRISFLARR